MGLPFSMNVFQLWLPQAPPVHLTSLCFLIFLKAKFRSSLTFYCSETSALDNSSLHSYMANISGREARIGHFWLYSHIFSYNYYGRRDRLSGDNLQSCHLLFRMPAYLGVLFFPHIEHTSSLYWMPPATHLITVSSSEPRESG